jgi:DNA-binding NtrC family response regulator
MPRHASPSSAPLLLDEGPSTSPHEGDAALPAGEALSLLDAAGNVRTLEDIESEVIRFAIARYRGQMSEVARRLRIGRSTLYRKLDDIGLGHGKQSADGENVATG